MQRTINRILNSRFALNGYLIFSPFLLYYIYYIYRQRWPVLFGDEGRYVNYANNLIHGFLSPPAPNINLWSGPGYSILLIPFAALHSPILYMAFLNAILYYLSVIFLFKALCHFINFKLAIVFGLLWAVYPNMIDVLPNLFTETFTVFLVTAFIYSITLLYVTKSIKYLIISGLVLGYLALVKVLFGYVLLLVLIVYLFRLILKKTKAFSLKSIYIILIAFVVTMPYLAYTYHLTGKLFYWGNSGGMSLYWMSTNYDQEYGDWKSNELRNSQFPVQFESLEGDSILQKNHQADIALVLKQTEIGRDSLFKKMALANIRQRPKKFIRNCIYNVSRMLFNMPFSFTYQDANSLRNIITGSLILWSSLIAMVLSIINWQKIIYPVKFLLSITFVYLMLTTALSAYPRMFDVIVPILLFWMALVVSKLPKLKLQFTEETGKV